VPATVSVLEAIDARQKSIDRMSGILLACATEEKKLRPIRSLALERRDWEGFREAEIAAMNSFSAEKADALFHHMALFETRSVPMLVDLRASPREDGLFDMLVRVSMLMHRAGVTILAGTGAGQGGIAPGETLHRELELLVAAGLTPAEALRTATLAPARYLGATTSLGAIEPGKIADLVLLDANPLADIRNTRKIAGVISGGKYLPSTAPVGKSK
jgi:hypothetical protein